MSGRGPPAPRPAARSAREDRRARRQQAAEARRRADERGRRQRTLAIAGAVTVAVAGAAALAFWLLSQPASASPGHPVPDIGNTHLAQGQSAAAPYSSDPPTSGPHWEFIARWGVHEESVPLQLQVHNLEDGGVIVHYRCPEGCPELVEQLKRVVQSYPDHVILTPYAANPTAPQPLNRRIALTAWSRIDAVDEFDERRIRTFIEAYRCFDHHVGRKGQRIPNCR